MLGEAVRSLGVCALGMTPRSYVQCERSCELPKEPQIVLGKQPDIGNVEQDHGETIHPQTEGESCPFLRIVGVVAALC